MSEKNPVVESKKKGSNRVDRGGGWAIGADYAPVAYRYEINPGKRYGDLGFRIARTKK